MLLWLHDWHRVSLPSEMPWLNLFCLNLLIELRGLHLIIPASCQILNKLLLGNLDNLMELLMCHCLILVSRRREPLSCSSVYRHLCVARFGEFCMERCLKARVARVKASLHHLASVDWRVGLGQLFQLFAVSLLLSRYGRFLGSLLRQLVPHLFFRELSSGFFKTHVFV